MFFFQRSDANLRNEWSNYSNWPYNYLPYDITQAPTVGTYKIIRTNPDGSYRENTQPAGIYNYIEKYVRTAGNAEDGLYCYNYCLSNSPFELQPSGAINMSRFTTIELEFVTIIPPLDPLAQTLTICDPATGNIIGINKPTWRIYDYNFNLVLFEERINMITFIGGNCGLMYAT